jgi:transposase-like protein
MDLDEMAVMIAGRQFWLRRAVDGEGEVLDLLLQRRRDKAAAVKLMRKLVKKRLRTRCAGDRQASLLRRGKVRDRIVGSP